MPSTHVMSLYRWWRDRRHQDRRLRGQAGEWDHLGPPDDGKTLEGWRIARHRLRDGNGGPIRTNTILSLALVGATALAAIPVPASAQQVKALCTENTRACLLKTTKVYVEGLGHHDPSRIPFSPTVRCTEQGNIPVTDEKTFRSEIAKSTAIIGIRNLRLFADPATQSVGAFFLIDIAGDKAKNASDYTVRRGERFKIVDGLITEVEAFNYVDPDLHGLAQPLWPG